MILRPAADALIVIRQPDHARPALAMLDAWRRDGVEARPRGRAIRPVDFIADRPSASDADLRAELNASSIERVAGTAAGW